MEGMNMDTGREKGKQRRQIEGMVGEGEERDRERGGRTL